MFSLSRAKLHLPVLLLQRSLRQASVPLRFMDSFLMLDYMTSQSGNTDLRQAERERLHGYLADFVSSEHPEHAERIKALKRIIQQAPLEERLSACLERLAIRVDDEILRDMLESETQLRTRGNSMTNAWREQSAQPGSRLAR